MPCKNLLYILNNKNKIEVYGTQNTQQLVQKSDCHPNIVKQKKFSEQYLLVNAQSEWIIRDLKLSQICKTKGDLINKCLFVNQKCITNQESNIFEWDLVNNQYKLIPIFQSI